MKKFISIIWGYPEHLNSFSREENVHLHPLSVAKKLGYDLVILTNSTESIKKCEYLDKDIKISEYGNVFKYILFLLKNSKNIFYVNSYEWRSFLVPFICRKAIFMGHTHVIRQNKTKQVIQKIVFKLFKRIRLNNDKEKKYLIEKDKINENKLFVVPLAVSLNSFYFNKDYDRRNIVYFGNVTKKKNLETILNSIRLVVDKYPDVKLDIIGNVWNNNIYNFIKDLNLDTNVKFLGFIPQSNISNILNRYLISVNSSFDEGQCVAVFDTALCGCALCLPNIMSFVGVFKDKALFHDVNDYNNLAKNIIKYIENTDLAREHNEICRNMIKKEYNCEVIENKIKMLFEII